MPHGGISLFLGPDRARKLQRIQQLERTLRVQALDRHQLDGPTLTGAQLLALCRQRPAVSPVRLIVVEQAHRLDQLCVEALRQHAAVIAENACLVLLVEVELSARHVLAKAEHWVTIERFPGWETVATKPFAFTDALGHRDVTGALATLHDQLVAGKEPLELLGLVVWQINRWAMVRRLFDEGCGAERIAAAMGLRPWQVERLRSEVAQRSSAMLERLLMRCWQLDVDAKSGRTLPALAVEELVVEVCQPAGSEQGGGSLTWVAGGSAAA